MFASKEDEADLWAVAVSNDDAVVFEEVGNVTDGLDNGGVLVGNGSVFRVSDEGVAADGQDDRFHGVVKRGGAKMQRRQRPAPKRGVNDRAALTLFGNFDGFEGDDVGVRFLDFGKQRGRGFAGELNAATGSLRTVEDDVLDFFDVDVGSTDFVHDTGQDADTVVVANEELPTCGCARGEVDAVENDAGFDEGLDDADGFGSDGFLGLFRRCADVVGAVEVRLVKQGIRKVGDGISWFGVEDIGGVTDFLCFERCADCRLVDDFAASGVNENGVGFHLRDTSGVDEFFRVGLEREVERDDVGAPEEVIGIIATFDVELFGLGIIETTGPGDDV